MSTISILENAFIISCQALEYEPLHGAAIMAAMASAAQEGGADGIRANSPDDIRAIKQKVTLPVIGLYKRVYPDSEVYITPTIHEVSEIVEAGADIIAIDATARPRPNGSSLEELIRTIRIKYPNLPILADISTYEEGIHAMNLGVDLVSTTMSGYTSYSPKQEGPDIELVRRLADLQRTPVVAEGRIWTAEDCAACIKAGAYSVVIGTAITRPQEIVKKFIHHVQEQLYPDLAGWSPISHKNAF